MDYPLFTPPPALYEKSHFDWTLKEARAYFDWFLGQVEPRTHALRSLLHEMDQEDASELLGRVGGKIVALVHEEPFSVAGQGSRDLTNSGYALGADAGLLLARPLLRKHPGVRWEIVHKPKRDMAFHLPVLVGMGPVYLDPIGGVIAELHGILSGLRGPSFLKDAYDFWNERAKGR